MGPALVIADDLTGACDVAAALLPWPGGVTVRPDGRDEGADGGLVVRNTQSRTLPAAAAARRVRATLAVSPWSRDGTLLKKIDTGLRGPLGAEIDAVLDTLGASRAFVLPAIPEVGRTTIGGEQRIDGVPVHRTAFATDPWNPVRDARVAAVIRTTGRRAATSIGLETVRRPGGVREALACRPEPVVVLDAETDADLVRGVEAVLEEARPLVLVGSIGLARVLRATWAVPRIAGRAPVSDSPPAFGVLAVVGSAHPCARRQRDHARASGALAAVLDVSAEEAEATGRLAAQWLRAGRGVALAAPDQVSPGAGDRVAAALRDAAIATLGAVRPAGLVLVGGETAYHVLTGLGRAALTVHDRPAPLAVQGRIASGPHRDLPVITKGGSSGPDDLLATLVWRLARKDG